MKNIKKTSDQFITEAITVHGDRYDYSQVLYVRKQDKIVIVCREHGKFCQSPYAHLRGQGCPKCWKNYHGDKSTNSTKNGKKFLAKAVEKFGDKFDYSKVNYTNSMTPVTIVCKSHGEFSQRPSDHLDKSSQGGCPECKWMTIGNKNRGCNQELVCLNRRIHRKCKDLLRNVLNRLRTKKISSTNVMLGYGRRDLRQHLVSHRNWCNIEGGKWHLDHVFPVKAFVEYGILDLKIINALDNLQPLNPHENLVKGDSYDKRCFEHWLLSRGIIFESKLRVTDK